jgi:hypothetical protein
MTEELNLDQRQRIASITSEQHDAITGAIQTLEAALASPGPGREAAWIGRVAQGLAPVLDAITEHSRLAEGPGGLVAELEATLGRPHALSVVAREHKRLASEANDLLESLQNEQDVSVVRARAARLTADLRTHQSHEADLIYEAFFRDIGVGD